MKDTYLSICRLLASSGFSDRDIAEFMNELIGMGPNTVLSDIRDIRRLTNTSPKRVYDFPTEVYIVPPSETAMKIERLLIQDAGLTRLTAIERLSDELHRRFPKILIPPESRKGFHTWIQKLSALIPEKELLHIAAKIRNRSVHEPPSDWRLRE